MKKELLEVISEIPSGKVTSYGRVAQMLDIRFGILTSGYIVGKILSGLKDEEWGFYPWQRVVNKQGYISAMKLGERGLIQKQLLEKEGIEVMNDSVDMKRYSYEFVV